MTKIFNQPKIASINFPTGKIVFEKDTTERLDLNNSFALKSMQLLDNSDVIIKKMQLHTSYMESLPVNANIFPVFLNSLEGAYRLRLDSLSIQDRHSETNGKYLFEYDTQKLPNRYSKSVDYFGYYNGKNNTSFLPKTFFTPPQSQNPNLFSFQIGSANRSVNPDFTQASVLKKIIYPTGGYDEFTWENNFVGQFSGNDTSYRDNLIDKNDFYFTNDINLPDVTLQGSTYIKNLTIPPNVEGFIEFNITMTGCTTLPNLNNDDCHFELTIRGITDPDFLYHIHQTNFNIKAIDLPAGDYKIMAKSRVTIVDPNQQTGGGPLSMFGISVKWSYDPNPNERIYSGLRIKKIETFDREDALAFSKSYDYQYLDTTNNIYKSSGHAINFIDVLDENYFVGCTIVPHPHTTSTIGMGYKLTARSQAPMEFTKGSLVGYTKVKEIFDGGLKGYKEYTYSFVDKYIPTITVQQDALNLNYYAPVSGLVRITENFKRQVYCDWLRGNVKNEETFSSSNLKLKSKMHDYEVVNTKTVPYFGIETIRNDPFPVVGTMMNPCPCDNIRAEFYSSVTEHHRLKRVTETNYFDNGTNGVTLTKEYAYNALSQMSEERVFDNNQLDKTTKYYYPSDASMSGKPCVSQLIAKHMIGLPLVTETYRDTEKLSTQETVYKNWGTTNNPLLLPEVVNTSKGGGVSETRLRYQAYDSQGNPTQVRAEQGLITSYIWGYNKTQPIAKLDNATNTQIANTLGIPFQDINESHLSVINNLRSNGPYFNVPITTLTYKPLVGVTSVTDPKGQTTTYEYDSFGRLERVKDHQGNILSENEYHYRTQN
jgi:YD repeat-containing protein